MSLKTTASYYCVLYLFKTPYHLMPVRLFLIVQLQILDYLTFSSYKSCQKVSE